MTIMTYKMQTNDKPWSDTVFAQDLEPEWRKRLRPFRGELRLDSPGETPGPFLARTEAIHRGVTKMTAQHKPGLVIFIANSKGKGVRVQAIEKDQPFGPIFHTIGACADSYPNIVNDHNMAGQLVKLQRPAMLAYHEAERINGRAIRITGIGWRSCSLQSSLYRSDPNRFANPDTSRHCRGLALDVYYSSDNLTSKAKAAMESCGWNFAVSGEPWHCSFVESA